MCFCRKDETRMSTQKAHFSGPDFEEKNHVQSYAVSLKATANCNNYAVETQIFENLITKDVLAKLLSLSVSYIDKLVRKKKIPYYKIGRCIRFRVGEVVAWLRSRRLP